MVGSTGDSHGLLVYNPILWSEEAGSEFVDLTTVPVVYAYTFLFSKDLVDSQAPFYREEVVGNMFRITIFCFPVKLIDEVK